MQLRLQIKEQRLVAREATTVLLGMGDNFAMDYFSRVFVLHDVKGAVGYIPKDEMMYAASYQGWVNLRDFQTPEQMGLLLEDQYAGQTSIDSDNVARFFTEQQYTALVPGKHNFYYGPNAYASWRDCWPRATPDARCQPGDSIHRAAPSRGAARLPAGPRSRL